MTMVPMTPEVFPESRLVGIKDDSSAYEFPLLEARRVGFLLAPIAPGELLDKLTILTIKAERIVDPAKVAQVRAELLALEVVRTRSLPHLPELTELTKALKAVNEALWQIEDDIRLCERAGDFGPRFVELARSIYHRNDERSRLKRRLNDLLGAPFGEQKAYAAYLDAPQNTA